MREPWWRSQTQHWYLEVNGNQVRLSKEKDPAGGDRKHPPPAVQNEWHRLMREGRPEDMQAGDLFAAFIRALTGEENQCTTRRQLAKFERFVGREMKVSALRPIKLTEFLQTKPHWSQSSVRTFVNRLHAALNWGVRQGLIAKNPISSTPGYRREGRFQRRKGVISDAHRTLAEENAAPEFRAILIGLRESGARPSELSRARVEKVFLQAGYMLVPNKTAHQTGEAERKIYLSPTMQQLLREQIGVREEGHVFRNRLGKPWNCHSLKKRWEALRKRTGIQGTLYQMRHTFASRAINQSNVNPALVAKLLGHTDLTMLLQHYLEEDPEALQKAVAAITGHQPGSRSEARRSRGKK
jgi:integrase